MRATIQARLSAKRFSGRRSRRQFKQTTVLVLLDGTAGYATSFLEEAFGGLARIVGKSGVSEKVTVSSDEEPYLLEEVRLSVAESEREIK